MTHVLISTLHRKFSSENLYKYIFAFVLKDTYCPTMQCTDMEVQLDAFKKTINELLLFGVNIFFYIWNTDDPLLCQLQ